MYDKYLKKNNYKINHFILLSLYHNGTTKCHGKTLPPDCPHLPLHMLHVIKNGQISQDFGTRIW